MTQELHDEMTTYISNGPNRWALILDAFVNKSDVELEIFHLEHETSKLKMVAVVDKIKNISDRNTPCDFWTIWGYLAHKEGEDQFRNKLCGLIGLNFLDKKTEPYLYFIATYSSLRREGRIKFSFDFSKVSVC